LVCGVLLLLLLQLNYKNTTTASITFSSIPQTYTDLLVLVSARGDAGGQRDCYISFNGSTSNFTNKLIEMSNNLVSSGTTARYIGPVSGTTTTANVFSNATIYIPNYTGSTYKSFSGDFVAENNAQGTNAITLTAQLWSNTAAITSIGFAPSSGSFIQYSTFYLYGISNS
jgi:hypothetical protein